MKFYLVPLSLNNNISCIGMDYELWMFNSTVNNISFISWRSVLLVETGIPRKKNTDTPQSVDKHYHIEFY